MGRAEAQATAAQESLTRTRKELEETRKKEVKLRERLNEYLENKTNENRGGGGGSSHISLREATNKIDLYDKENKVLKAQNIALRQAALTQGGGAGALGQ